MDALEQAAADCARERATLLVEMREYEKNNDWINAQRLKKKIDRMKKEDFSLREEAIHKRQKRERRACERKRQAEEDEFDAFWGEACARHKRHVLAKTQALRIRHQNELQTFEEQERRAFATQKPRPSAQLTMLVDKLRRLGASKRYDEAADTQREIKKLEKVEMKKFRDVYCRTTLPQKLAALHKKQEHELNALLEKMSRERRNVQIELREQKSLLYGRLNKEKMELEAYHALEIKALRTPVSESTAAMSAVNPNIRLAMKKRANTSIAASTGARDHFGSDRLTHAGFIDSDEDDEDAEGEGGSSGLLDESMYSNTSYGARNGKGALQAYDLDRKGTLMDTYTYNVGGIGGKRTGSAALDATVNRLHRSAMSKAKTSIPKPRRKRPATATSNRSAKPKPKGTDLTVNKTKTTTTTTKKKKKKSTTDGSGRSLVRPASAPAARPKTAKQKGAATKQ